MDKAELIKVVQSLMNPEFLTEKESDEIVELLEKNKVYQSITKLILYNKEEFTAEEIVEKILAKKKIPLSDKFD